MKIDFLGPYSEDKIHPGFSVDCVILSFHKNKIKVLLRESGIKNCWSLLGGFVFNNEDADMAANRVMQQFTGVNNIYLKQFHLFSDPKRIAMTQLTDFFINNKKLEKQGKWLLHRFITMGYYALLKYDEVVMPDEYKKALGWFDINKLPQLYSDHGQIIEKALLMIRAMFPNLPIAYELLPEKFTMTELRKIHEIILEKKFDRRNFQRKILADGEIIQLDETKTDKSYNPPILYSYNQPENNLIG